MWLKRTRRKESLGQIKKNKNDAAQAKRSPAQQMVDIMKMNSELRKNKYKLKIYQIYQRLKPILPIVRPILIDESDLFYLTMSRTAKCLPYLVQARLKLDISRIILQAEILNAEQQPSTRNKTMQTALPQTFIMHPRNTASSQAFVGSITSSILFQNFPISRVDKSISVRHNQLNLPSYCSTPYSSRPSTVQSYNSKNNISNNFEIFPPPLEVENTTNENTANEETTDISSYVQL